MTINITTVIPDYYKNLPQHVTSTLNEYNKLTYQNRFFIYKDYILNTKDLKKIKFNNNRWSLRPYLFCYDNYSESEQYLYPILLTINNINSIHLFKLENFKDQIVLTPSVTTIKKILSFK